MAMSMLSPLPQRILPGSTPRLPWFWSFSRLLASSIRHRHRPMSRSGWEGAHMSTVRSSSSSSSGYHSFSATSSSGGAAPSYDQFLLLAHLLADASGQILLDYFRKPIQIEDKHDLSPVTIADRAAEATMCNLISERFPSHAIFGEESGLKEPSDYEYVWVLDPIDGTKSFITGKPVFGTLISLVHKGIPVIGIIDQPVLRERWVGVKGEETKLNGLKINTRSCTSLDSAYLYTTSPHLFSGAAERAFARVRDKVKVPLYGCDCYAYGLLAAGHVDIVIESGLKPYDLLALVPVVEGAGGIITDWNGEALRWWPSNDNTMTGTDVIAAGDIRIHKSALDILQSSYINT